MYRIGALGTSPHGSMGPTHLWKAFVQAYGSSGTSKVGWKIATAAMHDFEVTLQPM